MSTSEVHVTVSPERKSWVESTLSRLASYSAPFLVNVHSYRSEATPTSINYTLVLDEVQSRFEILSELRAQGDLPELSPTDCDKFVIACVNALAFAAEKKLGLAELPLAAVFFTRENDVKINLFDALQYESYVPLKVTLFLAVYNRYPKDEEEQKLLLDRVTPDGKELVAGIIAGEADYQALLARGRGGSNRVYCFHCHSTKASSFVQICERHAFCSEACLSQLREATTTYGSQCPLCTVKVPKGGKVVMRPKEERKGVEESCVSCGKRFLLRAEDGWRVELLGSAVSEKGKKYCSLACFQTLERNEERTGREVTCAHCGKAGGKTAIGLHCEQHCLCTVECRQAYYRTADLAPHSLNGALICYQCLESYLAEVGVSDSVPDLVILAKKLTAFKSRREDRKQPQEANPHASHICRQVAECPTFISPSHLKLTYFRTPCLFCARSVLIQKHATDDFVLDDASPLLIYCDFRLHGVCSRRCLRDAVPRTESTIPRTVRCPKCPSSLIYGETLNIALNSRNPTQEVIRRTPVPDQCAQHCPLKYSFDGCRHELCGSALSRLLTQDNLVVCPICGFRSSVERVVAGEFENKVVHEVKDKDY